MTRKIKNNLLHFSLPPYNRAWKNISSFKFVCVYVLNHKCVNLLLICSCYHWEDLGCLHYGSSDLGETEVHWTCQPKSCTNFNWGDYEYRT